MYREQEDRLNLSPEFPAFHHQGPHNFHHKSDALYLASEVQRVAI